MCEEEEATPLTFSNDLCANKDEKGCKIRIFFLHIKLQKCWWLFYDENLAGDISSLEFFSKLEKKNISEVLQY